MIRSLYFSPNGQLQDKLPVEKVPEVLKSSAGLLWVDFESTPPETDAPILLETFGFHPLAVEDALQETHVPRVDDWGKYLYVVLHAMTFDRQEEEHVDSQELDVFLGPNYLVTHHDQPIAAITQVWTACQRDQRHLMNGADYLLYKILDELIAGYMPVVEEMDDAIDLLEDRVFDNPSPDTVEHIFALKRAVLQLRRNIVPQREVLNKLARDDYEVINAKTRVYFRDVYDHLVRLHDITEGIRDLLSGTLDTYLSVINNRMNDIMKTLTIITTLFMPITFVTGFFGMNFFQPSAPPAAWTGRLVFILILILMLLTPLGMYLWMRRRGWM